MSFFCCPSLHFCLPFGFVFIRMRRWESWNFRVTYNNNNMILHNIFLSVFSLVYKCRCDFYINFKMSNFYHYDHHIIIFLFFLFFCRNNCFFFYLLLERFNILRNKQKKSICQVEIETERVERRHNDRT